MSEEVFNFNELMALSPEEQNREDFLGIARGMIQSHKLSLMGEISINRAPFDENMSDEAQKDFFLSHLNNIADKASAKLIWASVVFSTPYDPLMKPIIDELFEDLVNKLERVAMGHLGYLHKERPDSEGLQNAIDEETGEFFRMRIFDFSPNPDIPILQGYV
jgi:hypothetical protein